MTLTPRSSTVHYTPSRRRTTRRVDGALHAILVFACCLISCMMSKWYLQSFRCIAINFDYQLSTVQSICSINVSNQFHQCMHPTFVSVYQHVQSIRAFLTFLGAIKLGFQLLHWVLANIDNQSWQPGLCLCKYLIEWVAGGWSLTFVSKQAESH